MKRRILTGAAVCLIVLLGIYSGFAISVSSVTVSEKEWRWDPGATAEFEGSVTFTGGSADDFLTMSMSAEAIPEWEEMKDPVFTSVDGKKISVRHQQNEYTCSGADGTVQFTGGWTLPAENRVENVTIRLQVRNRDGRLIEEATLRMNRDTGKQNHSGVRFPDPGQWTWFILGGAGIIWILAGIRIYRNRQGR